jgi:hypothetical protein
MRFTTFKSQLSKSGLAATVLLLGSGAVFAQQQINLTAGPANAVMPDGSTVPMWGYSCDSTQVNTSLAKCAALNPNAGSNWSPVVITVPAGAAGGLTINLTNNLSFGTSGATKIPTSITIVGQLGGGLGARTSTCPAGTDASGAICAASPTHAVQDTTWPIAAAGAQNVPPPQEPRVQSFATEVAATAACTTTPCPVGTALTWSLLKPGTYLIESGTHPSIQGPMGLYGILVVTAAPTATTTTPVTETAPGCAYPGTTAGTCASPNYMYDAEVPMLLSEIDPVQNTTVSQAVNTPGFSEATVWSGQPNGCGNPSSSSYLTCYPPAVNYTPLYYMVNGVAFNKNNTSSSVFPVAPAIIAPATNTTGNVLVRIVNAGLRMHVPSIVGSQVTGATGGTNPIVTGFKLIAEDGNPLPGVPRVQSEVFMAAGKTYDVMINGQSTSTSGTTTTIAPYLNALALFDRELSLSANALARDAGMLAYISIDGKPAAVATGTAVAPVAATANADHYILVPGQTLTVSDPKGVLANDVGIYTAQVVATPSHGTVSMNAHGTFVYYPDASGATTDTFTYCGNGTLAGAACAVVMLVPSSVAGAGVKCTVPTGFAFTSTTATSLAVKTPGVLGLCKDSANLPLSVRTTTAVVTAGLTSVIADTNGGFTAVAPAAGTYNPIFRVQNTNGQFFDVTVPVTFLAGSGLTVNVLDGPDKTSVTDYRWIIEEDRTFYVNPACTTNPPPSGCPTAAAGIVPTFGTNFHTSYMPVVAAGCTGPLSCESGQTLLGMPAVCDVGNGVCRTDASQQTAQDPSTVHLDPTKRYYISVLPGDAANSFENVSNCLNAASFCGHGMGGAPIVCQPAAGAVVCTATSGAFPQTVNVIVQRNPFPPSKLSVFVFEDDFPLNGEQDGGGGVDVLSPNEPGLGGFNIILFDDAGGTGDATGQMTYDMFNMPLSNGLAGTIDPATGKDACPVSGANQNLGFDGTTVSPTGITGTIVTCPKYESDGTTLSPLAGQAVISNLMPGRYGVVATPGADRIARGEEWLQTNTLDGQKAHDSFLRVGEPSFFQEYGPAGFHVSIGFANPAIINARKAYICGNPITDPNAPPPPGPRPPPPQTPHYTCNNTVTGTVTTERMSRTPDERLYSSGDNSSFGFTQCYVSFGDADGEDFAFTKCDSNGSFTLSGLPEGDWRITVFDQWNDMLVDGLSTPVRLAGGSTLNLGDIATNQWQANIYTTSFLDQNGNGVRDGDEPGLALVSTNIRFRDGSYSNFNNTDLQGNAGFNEVFPLFSWYVVEGYSTRYKSTGTHVVYDAGGPSDGSTCGGTTGKVCGNSNIAHFMANTAEQIPLPANLRVPGAYYCGTADCTNAPSPLHPGADPTGTSTGRVDPPFWFGTEGWQGFSGQNSFIEFGKKPYAPGETGGIFGEVIYASTRPFDDPALLIHTSWTPDVPNVVINLYQEGTAPDGTALLKLVDTTKTSSWDDWAQGFRPDGMPNMNCPGQGTATGTNADLFFYSLQDQPQWLDQYNNGGTAVHTMPAHSQFKCYDGMHNWNQVQPAPYDGMYSFPSVTGINPTTGEPSGTNCTVCIPNPDATDPYRHNQPMLPPGKYVVEVVVPPGYELVKEEDKNILIGDNYIAPVTQEFAGLGNIFILPDQAEVAAYYNANNAQNPTVAFGRTNFPSGEGDTGSVEIFWPCAGAARIVPDYISLFPQSGEVAPFAGATRNLCDRKEVTLTEQTAALAKFWIFSSTHTAAHFTGVITDDYTSEFDPFSPQFGEKFSPPDLPVSIKDWTGTEISRVYADHWGAYNGLTYSTWEVNPPNPTGYAPTMMVTCMNDPGTGPTPDPLFNPQYSQFCYEIPFMPGQTQYMDTPVVPTSAFAGAGYNNPDCSYPAQTPAIAEVDGDGIGPWVSSAGSSHTLTITGLGDQMVPNNAYTGPSATTPPYNQKKVLRHYGFGAQCTSATPGSATCNTLSSVTIGGVSAPITGWSDTAITVTVPAGVPNCAVQQQAQYGGSTAQCGQLVITGGNGKQSIDTVTVTIGGSAPKHVAASDSIQAAIDAAKPGDLIVIDPTCATTAAPTSPVACTTTGATVHSQAAHQEIVLMWKPVRLQGVGAASSVINANTHPAGETKLTAWRKQVNCLFGLGLDGHPSTWNANCGAGWTGFNASPGFPQIDRLATEATVGWDASLNGNLAELLQEPSLMGALEGAAITVLSKGVNLPPGGDTNAPTAEAGFPDGTTLLTGNNCGPSTGPNPFPSNFQCNPSSIDGLSLTDSSQGGGGIFVHAWGHNLQIANNRIYNNAGTLSGGINIGQGEFPPNFVGGPAATNLPPGSCQSSITTNLQLPYCHNLNVNVHHNAVTSNSSTGDELFSATPAGAGGVSICTGSDYYKFNYNWVCGNLSTGDGGGVAHIGFSYGGDIEHNQILFNQSTNPTIPTNGGGLLVMGSPDVDPTTCGTTTDLDCLPAPGSVGPSDGIGPGLYINANLIMGNQAESGSGGGLALQHVNGSDVINFPNGGASVSFPGLSGSPNPQTSPWYAPLVTNNIIVNNVSGWDGGGVSLIDALNVNIINNTIMSNDSTASSGMLFDTIGAPLASTQGVNCTQTPVPAGSPPTLTCPQVAGLVSIQNSATLRANFPASITCPINHGVNGPSANNRRVNGDCRKTSYPELFNDVFWQNRTFYIGVGALGTGTQNQQNVVTLYNAFTTTQAPSQATTGACPTASYWDIGVRGDTGPGNHASTVTLSPEASILTSIAGYPGGGVNTGFRVNSASPPAVVSQYCNGSRVPPEAGGLGWQVPPGISDATVPNPIFNLTPAATVDEGNNWVNIAWGPLAETNPVTGATLGNYALAAGSPAINYITQGNSPNTYGPAPATDFFGNVRKTNADTAVDVGAVEFGAMPPPPPVISAALTPPSWFVYHVANCPSFLCNLTNPAQVFTLTNTGNVPLTGITQGVLGGANPADYAVVGLLSTCGPAGTNGQIISNTTLAPGANCVVTVQFRPRTAEPPAAKPATISVTDAAGTQTSALNGTDLANAPAVTFSAPTPIPPSQPLTTTPANTSTKNAVITVNYPASALVPLILSANPTIAKVGLAGGTFSIQPGGTCVSGAVVNPGGNCTINVRYVPGVSTATASANVTITGNLTTGTQIDAITAN